METKKVYLGLDVGTRRIGVAAADSIAKIAQPIATLPASEDGIERLRQYIKELDVTHVIVGRPRNQSGLTTGQTASVEEFAARTLNPLKLPIIWQDESVTSVLAEERLQTRNKPYTKEDIDAEAATIILQDFLEEMRHGHKNTS